MIQQLWRNLKRRKSNSKDYISPLGDDILLKILSKLEIKEQARTSVLSTRWRILWTFNTCCINIDASDLDPIAELIQATKGGQTKAQKFVITADQILRLHSHQIIDELKIDYFKGTLYPSKSGGWIEIAREKQVKSLHLNFQAFRKNPLPLLSLGPAPFSSLVTLHLEYASLSSHTMHHILRSAPNLMELSVLRAVGSLENLKISGSSIKLKHLELIDNRIDLLEISAANLVSFSFGNAKQDTKICFESIPLLTQLSFPQGLTSRTWHDYRVVLPQLATLDLTLVSSLTIPIFPTMENLKQMHIRLFEDVGGVLGLFSGLFEASPSLQRLLLNFRIFMYPHDFVENYHDHKFLEVIEINNFGGFDTQVQILICIAKCSPSLRKIIIHPNVYKIDYIKSLVENLPSRLPQKELEILLKVRNTHNE